ncbi:hypothetical protein F7734_41170 [Scytonema sp. UIC 10036]|uniref:hypothetical protein n=1 Tax=Scytonema sp. UIC 10036 TaxID=2304196 RepID=UPI0012DAD9A1|nr:hypothetical protein [Scytonema sp. UIC 10036]MUG98376.1 hypothetical protein [Scytonema sp. UIC 10036]
MTKHIYIHPSFMALENISPKPPKKKLPSGKSVYLLLIASLTLPPVIAAIVSPSCNPVSVHFKSPGFKYKYQKGACSNLPEQQRGNKE